MNCIPFYTVNCGIKPWLAEIVFFTPLLRILPNSCVPDHPNYIQFSGKTEKACLKCGITNKHASSFLLAQSFLVRNLGSLGIYLFIIYLFINISLSYPNCVQEKIVPSRMRRRVYLWCHISSMMSWDLAEFEVSMINLVIFSIRTCSLNIRK